MSDTKRASSSDTKADDKIVDEARKRWKRAEEWESEPRVRYVEDLKFKEGDSDNGWQWPDTILSGRQGEAKPCLTLNKVRQHCLHIINDARQNKASIKITPTGDGATYDAAQMLEGICRHIEYQSNATEAYEAGVHSQVSGGWGYWRVLTDYPDDGTLDLELYIRRIANPLTVYLDNAIQQFDGSDAKWGFVFRDRPRTEAEIDNPDLIDGWGAAPLGNNDGWLTEDTVREAEYYRVVEETDTLHLLDDGSKVTGAVPDGRISLRSRSVTNRRVEWFKIVGDTIVDREDWPGRYVPIVRVIGEETVIDGKLDRKGHTRFLKDAQRMENYWFSAAVEHVALQGKTPFVAAIEAIEGHETYWNSANTENHAVLPFNHKGDDGREIPAPQRQAPPTMAPAYLEGMKLTDLLLMQVSGQYQAELGRPGNETSGVAITQRQRQGDNATYHYIDHLAQAIRYTGRILIDLIPHIYDTPRVLKILGEDGSESEVHIDPTLQAAHAVVPDPTPPEPDPSGQTPTPAEQAEQRVRTVLNPAIGKYQVEADVGPSFGTQRQEAFNAFTQIVSQNASLMPVVGDLLFKNADFPGADDIAERLRRMVPPAALGGPPPQVQQLQQHLQATQQHAQQIAQQADAEVAGLKQQIAQMQAASKDRSAGTTIDDYRAETDRLDTIAKIDPDAAKVLVRTMLSGLLEMPALPVMQAHAAADAAHAQAIAALPSPMPPDAAGPPQ